MDLWDLVLKLPLWPNCRLSPPRLKKAPFGAPFRCCEYISARQQGAGLREILRREIPVDQVVQEILDELGTQVAVVYVVGMLPHVYAQQRLVAGGERRAGGAHVDDVHRAVGLLHQPGPAGAKVAHGRGLERLLEFVKAAPLPVDRVGQFAGGRAAAVRLHAVPEEGVVPHLCGVVVDAAGGRFPDDRFQVEALVLGALDQVVQVGHIGLVVLGIVIFECLSGHVRLQRVHRIGQSGQGVFHSYSPC
jgi:hypothetical protein